MAGWIFAGIEAPAPVRVGGALLIDRAEMCPQAPNDCTDESFNPVLLPNFPKTVASGGRHHATYRFTVTNADFPKGLPAIFLPQFSDAMVIWADGKAVSPDRSGNGKFNQNWNRPYYASFSRAYLEGDETEFVIYLKSHEFARVSLYPMYLGRAAGLEFAAQIRHIQRLGWVRLGHSFALVAAITIFGLWLVRRHDRTYLWLSFICFMAFGVSTQLTGPNLFNITDRWWSVWNSAMMLCSYGFLRLVMLTLDDYRRWPSRIFLALVLLFSATAFVLPVEYFRQGSIAINLLCGAMVVMLLSLYFYNWPRLNGLQKLHIPVLGAIGGAALAEFIYFHVNPHWVATHRSNLAVLTLYSGLFISLVVQLARTLLRYERLTHSMQDTIDVRTEELQSAHHRIAKAEKAHAIDEERRRIMLDLHDGVGGQLVNILSYLSQSKQRDPIVHASLEEALRDMALVIDSLEGTDDLGVMLASLRQRMDPLLTRHGMTLSWNVHNTPNAELVGGSKALNIVRIVQECITNATKHSSGDKIAIEIYHDHVTVTDNGQGFDTSKATQKSGVNSGLGLRGMHQRAKENGLRLDIQSQDDGTAISISWDPKEGNI